jgi:NADH-quinone oxidoreductase subunit L
MRNMGGLGRNMPVTMWTFIIGGASLAGFPLITAGFWSKDEILADAFNASFHTPMGIFVLVCLSLAAILTAFYTYRQIAMTFWGEPRSEAARLAQHNDGTGEGRYISVTMTAPLIVLAFFAIFAGYVGVHPEFPIFGPLVKSIFGIESPFANFVGRTLLEPPPHLAFNWWPVLISFTVFTLGVLGGYVLYSRREYAVGVPDPVEGILGSDLYRILQNKYYFDEFYVAAFVNPLRWFAETFTNEILDKGIIDGILHVIGHSAVWVGNLFREFNRVVIDGVGDGIPDVIADAARSLRSVQTGHIQQYLLYALIASVWVGANLVLIVVFPNVIGWAAAGQAVVAVILILFYTMGSSRASS